MIAGRLPDIKKNDLGKYLVIIETVTPTYDSNASAIVIDAGSVLGTNNLIDAIVVLENPVVDGKLYALDYTVDEATGKITAHVYVLGYDSTNSALTITEVTDNTTLGSLKLKVIGICY